MRAARVYMAWAMGSVLLALALPVAMPTVGTAQRPPPPSIHDQIAPCFATMPLGSGGSPPMAPIGLEGAIIRQGPSNTVAVRLDWQPVDNAACVAIEEQGPDVPQWTVTIVVPSPVSQTVLDAVSISQPGQYCFRAYAANDFGRSGYSNQTCVSVAGVEITFMQGWNMVGGIGGGVGTPLQGVDGPLYTFDPEQSTYVAVDPASPLRADTGYWAYFDAPTTDVASASMPLPVTVQAPAGKWIMIGNPSAVASAEVSGADAVLIYDAAAGYQPSFTLAPGQGAWAYSAVGSEITITPESP